MSPPASRWTSTFDAPACLLMFESASPSTARRSGATAGLTRVRTGPTNVTVGRNFRVASARSAIRLTSVWMSEDDSAEPSAKIDPADVLDRGVQVVDRLLETRGDLRPLGLAGGALQSEPDREQPLDHEVVQVAADPVPILEQHQPFLVLSRPRRPGA